MVILESLYPWLNLFLGLFILIEALVLFLGMNILVSETVDWATLKNNGILLIDIISGLGILYFSFYRKNMNLSTLFYVFLLVILVSHLYREIEFFTSHSLKFV